MHHFTQLARELAQVRYDRAFLKLLRTRPEKDSANPTPSPKESIDK